MGYIGPTSLWPARIWCHRHLPLLITLLPSHILLALTSSVGLGTSPMTHHAPFFHWPAWILRPAPGPASTCAASMLVLDSEEGCHAVLSSSRRPPPPSDSLHLPWTSPGVSIGSC
ncbi:hypothetical protein FB45DRAFT_367760 [Roridomyces roridus]|uniref:Uncharacterized protein n=1 Tax=Roridomyces roridus TaxID=1738132 RepID=A0AAD7B4A5_9AGAR|nr:hypothetical protein FB45DRAFT_367760 [Roridomyces roridus]